MTLFTTQFHFKFTFGIALALLLSRALAGAAGRGGQTQTTSSTGGGSSPLTSAIGGAQLGSAFTDWWGRNNSSNNIVSTPATGYSAYDGNGGGWNAWSNFGSGAD